CMRFSTAEYLENFIDKSELTNNLTIYNKVYIYNQSKRVYYCIHVDRKGALDGFFAIFSYEYRSNSIERRKELCLM
ncbi:MAG: hypothetical protein K2N00_02325, partial [Lachnospiraceae bacterium]|nr:hypothetical protein [Lachnospiraceae bacterium]